MSVMLGQQTENHSEDDECNCALFLAGEEKHPESFAQAHVW